MAIPESQQVYLIELCSGEQRRWRYLGTDARGTPWWRDEENGLEFNEGSLMYAWQIVSQEREDMEESGTMSQQEAIPQPRTEPAPLLPDIHRLVVEQMAEALILADSLGMIRGWNAAATALFGFSREEALGASLDLIIPERLRAAHWAGFNQAIARGATQHGHQARLTRALHAGGQRLYVTMSFAVIVGDNGQVMGSVAVAREASAPAAAKPPGSPPAS